MPNQPHDDHTLDRLGAATLLPHHREHLARSGLSDATIEAANLFSVTDSGQARELLNWRNGGDGPPVPAIAFPYWVPEGYARLRPDQPRTDKDGRPTKYEAPLGQPPRLYVPWDCFPDQGGRETELLLTEGEKKALAGCQAGIPTVAGGGIFGFHDATARQAAKARGEDIWPPLPELVQIVSSRDPTIAFDSDIDENSEVMRAATVLARMLHGVARSSRITFLPSPGGKKVGLDDLFVACHGNPARFREELFAARRPAEPHDLLEWTAGKLSTWSASQRALELRRAMAFCLHLLPREQFAAWRARASERLGVGKNALKEVERSIRAQMAQHPQQDPSWLTAPGYTVSAQGESTGVWWKGSQGENATLVAVAPINVYEVGTDEDGVQHVGVKWRYGQDTQSVLVPRLHIAGPDLLQLAARGAPVTLANRGRLQDFLARQEQVNLDRIPRIRVFNRFGWSKDLHHFALGRFVVGEGGGRAIAEADEQFLDALRPSGDIAIYKHICREVIAASHAAEAGWAVGYAPPLLRLLGHRSFLLSFWGPSHGGKSADQALAVSTFGRPEGLKLTGDATPTAVEANLSRCNDITSWVDDTQQTRSRALLDGLAYQVGGGTGRARGTVTGGLCRIANWTSIGFVSGEHPLLKINAAAGARNRTLELQVVPMTRALAADVHVTLRQHHGLTGPAFVEELLHRFIIPGKLDELDDLYRSFVTQLSPEPGDQPGLYVALIALADFLARIWVLGDEEHSARTAAVSMGRALIGMSRSQRDTAVDSVDAGYEAIVAWVVENDALFHPEPDVTAERPLRGPLKRLGLYIDASDADGRRVVAILGEPLREAMEKAGFNFQELLHGLLERGLLVPGEESGPKGPRLGRKTMIGRDRARAYWVVLPEDGPDGDVPGGRPFRRGNMGHGNGPQDPHLGVICPTVPDVPPVETSMEVQFNSEEETPTRVFTIGTTGTVGLLTLYPEEIEERIGAYVGPPPVPPGVPLAVPVGHQPDDYGRGYELVTTPEAAEQACARRATDTTLYVGICTFPVAAPSGAPVLSHVGSGCSQRRVRKPKKDDSRVSPHNPGLTTIRLVMVLGSDGIVRAFDVLALQGVPDALRRLLTNDQVIWVGFEMLAIARALRRHHGLEVQDPVDLRFGAVLADGSAKLKDPTAYTLSTEVARHLGQVLPSEPPASTWGEPVLPHAQLVAAARSVAVLPALRQRVAAEVERAGVGVTWWLENQAIPATVSMEAVGFRVDREKLERLEADARAEMNASQERALDALGDPTLKLTNDAEVKQRVERVYGITLADAKFVTLEAAAPQAQALYDVVKFKRAKYRMDWARIIIDAIQPDGRVHPTFDLLGTVAGRLNCDKPPMLNLPKGDEFRACFITDPGEVLGVADYSMAQVRIVADHTQDPEMLRCLRAVPEICLHKRTSAAMLGKPIEQVTPGERQLGKPVVFGVTYGQQPRGLMKSALDFRVTFTLEEATAFRNTFLETYSGIQAWHEHLARLTVHTREVRSVSGRLRALKDHEARVSVFAASFAQGSEADILKLALPSLHRKLKPLGGSIRTVFHDAVVVGGTSENAEAIKAVLVECMQEAMSFFVKSVPAKVDAYISNSWAKP